MINLCDALRLDVYGAAWNDLIATHYSQLISVRQISHPGPLLVTLGSLREHAQHAMYERIPIVGLDGSEA